MESTTTKELSEQISDLHIFEPGHLDTYYECQVQGLNVITMTMVKNCEAVGLRALAPE